MVGRSDDEVRSPRGMASPPPGEEVVIAGIAGRFPESDNMRHFEENLLNKKDLVTSDDRRWKLDHPEIPQRTGKINNVGKFDALFFGVHFKQAHTMDPMNRMLMEHTYEAIVDAGINPRQLRGSRTGVFIGACFSESEKTWFYEKLQVNGFGITGCSRAMLANRISYWLGVTGPSYTVDSACSSSLFAMEHAYRAIRTGMCDSAIVGGSNLCLHPYVSLQFSRLGVLSPDGCCKSFDVDANGYVRSEAVAVVFLQRAKDAKRVYATLVHGKVNCDGFKEQGITFPSSVMQSVLLQEFYEECGIPPSILGYVEAHGTGTKVGDPEEVNALDKVFCPGRTTPLRIGAVKSNLGHSEPASGLCSIAKVVIAMETGYLPPNLHYKQPREGVKALENGRIQVITEKTPWEGGYVGVNSFGFGGANAHILLKSNAKEKVNGGAPDDDLPRLVAVSGRTEEAAAYMLNDITSRPVDVEYVRLFHDIHAEEIPSHMYRGYAILPPRGIAETPLKEIQHYPGAKRPIWFVFSGMGSQWPGMGESLMQLPIFAEAVKKCHAVLKPRGVDIYDILTNRDRKTFDNILNSFVGIATVQIGLVDVLRSVGIVPDGIIGHSVGELGCAYADGCFTAEQMVLAAYSRGLASIETKVVFGSMAAVGLGYDDVKDLCPPDIEVACHNGPDSSTISGPAESMKLFVAKLQANKIFAREVPCSNIPYHSRYIAPAGPKLLAYLQQVITDPKPRSQKWKSSSVPRSEWSSPLARLSSAEYHTNNLLSPVLFEETATLIPKNAVTIEIAPHGLLQAILRTSLHEDVTNIAMTKRGHENNVQMVLQALGKLFITGLHPDLRNLYPEVRYPVSRGTPMISPLIKWEHSEDWYVTSYKMQEKIVSGERVVELEMTDETYEYMQGHVIDGRVLVPAIGYLSLIWETVGMMLGQLFTEVSVLFEDVKFIRATSVPSEGKIQFTLMVQKGTGRFEVIEGGAAIVTGMVHTVTDPSRYKIKIPPTSGGEKAEEDESMSSDDFYKELRLRGYQYSGQFRSVKEASFDGSEGKINWDNNWVTFMDNMLQLKIIGMDTRGLFVPTGIQELLIDTKTHLNEIRAMPDNEKVFPVKVYKNLDTVVSGGVQIRGMTASAIARRKPVGDPVLEEYKFVPHIDRTTTTLSEAVRLATHVALENHLILKFKTIEVVADTEEAKVEELLSPLILDILGDIPLLQADVSVATSPDKFTEGSLPDNIFVADFKKLAPEQNAAIAVGRNLIQGGLEGVLPLLKEGGFVLSRESLKDGHDGSLTTRPRGAGALMDVVLERRTDQGELLVLLRKRDRLPRRTEIVQVRNDDFDWLPSLKKILKSLADKESTGQTKVLLVGQGDFECGLLGLVNCLRKEPGGEAVRAVLIQDVKAPEFDLENPLYAERMPLDLAVDVLRPGGIWGSYRHLPLPALEHVPVHHAFVNQSVRGDLSSLQWYAGPITPEFRHKDLIRVLYAPLNFRDVMLATGKLATEVVAKNRQQQESSIGFEFCGIDPAGRRVMGMTHARGMTNLLVADRLLSWVVPDDWTMEDAATVPCVYATCYYAFYVHGHLKKGERVLIHAGSGGVGQAAITLALHEGCEVFTTVGTPEKRRFIRERFPRIDDSHIGNSRDTSFEQMIMTETNGRGVDIVLNSLSEDKLQASVRCLAERGRFLEIGKFDLAADNHLGMRIFLKEVSFHGVMVDHLFQASDEAKAELWKVMDKGLRSGAIRPLTRVVFEKDQLETAFRYMAGGKHIGKVILKVRDEGEAPNAGIAAVPYFQCLKERSYVILGGLGGFGLELADWLVLRGARNLVLTSRTGISNGYQRSRIHLWKSYGARVLVVVGKDASKSADCREILESAAKLGPVDGIFNLAVQLRDNLLENQTEKAFEESFVGKARSTKRLDELSRAICPKLRHFVVFSSISCGRGNGGQTNYGMANSVMERICEKRVADGLPGLAVQWGAVGDVGLVAAMAENRKELSIGGTLRQGITSCLQELDGFLHRGCPIVSSMVVAEKRAGGCGSTDVLGTVLNIMGLKDLKTVGHHTSLAELGMDSIMAVEIKQTLEREFEIFLTAQDIRALNFAKLIEMAKREAEQGKTKKKIDGDTLIGMKLLVRILGDEELDLNTFLKLETKAEIGRSEVFLIPGVEGFGTIFSDLASKLKCPACCLQLGIGRPEDNSIDDMVDHLLPDFLARSKDRRNFFLVGYSFGAVIAIELARRLEAEGLSGRLLLIDGAPDQLKALGDQHLPATTEEEVQNNVLLGMMDLLAPAKCPELTVQLDKYNIWEEKLEAFMTIIPDSVSQNMSPKIRRGICTSVYKRLSAIRKYDSSALPPIRSPIILLKPTMPALKSSAEDYGLGKITRDTVEVHYLQGNHLTIIEHEKVATAINGEPLEDAESFKERIMEDGKILAPITLSEQQRS